MMRFFKALGLRGLWLVAPTFMMLAVGAHASSKPGISPPLSADALVQLHVVRDAQPAPVYFHDGNCRFLALHGDHSLRLTPQPSPGAAQFYLREQADGSFVIAHRSGLLLEARGNDPVALVAEATPRTIFGLPSDKLHGGEEAPCGVKLRETPLVRPEQKHRPQRLAVIGDSLSTGLLADTNVRVYPDNLLDLVFDELTMRDMLVLQAQRMAGGGYDLKRVLTPVRIKKILEKATKPELAVLTTSEEWGLRQALAELHELSGAREVSVTSVARNGQRCQDGLEQVNALKNKKFDYIAMMLGANDIAHGTPYDDFTRAFDAVLNRLLKEHAGATILLPLIPRITAVQHVALSPLKVEREVDLGTFYGGKQYLNFETNFFNDLRRTNCPAVFVHDARVADQRIDEFNSYIRAQALAYRHDFAGRLVVLEASQHFEVTDAMVAVDGFHLSSVGQAELGRLIQRSLRAQAEASQEF